MRLVRKRDYSFEIDPELLLIKPFRKLWDQDKTESKTKFMDFLSLIYYGYDPRSAYGYIVDEDSRLEKICKDNGFKMHKFTELEKSCIEIYKSMNTTTSLALLQDTRIAIEKVRKFLRDVDLTETVNGKPVYTVNTITNAIKQIPQLAKEVLEIEKLVAKELEEEEVRARGGMENKKILEGGVDGLFK